MSIRIKENYYKVVWRWYLTPIRLNQIDKKYSKQCWRGCQENGTYIHMWWSCKYVQKFWENVFKEIKGITKIEIIGTPEIQVPTSAVGGNILPLSLNMNQNAYTTQN
uniref:Reverse transcriptase zinc-binding domain-containing protein n=1 Tax=Anolis carolinensis TaxID=28377 RepID=A0A803SS40_ANOCA